MVWHWQTFVELFTSPHTKRTTLTGKLLMNGNTISNVSSCTNDKYPNLQVKQYYYYTITNDETNENLKSFTRSILNLHLLEDKKKTSSFQCGFIGIYQLVESAPPQSSPVAEAGASAQFSACKQVNKSALSHCSIINYPSFQGREAPGGWEIKIPLE